MSDYKPTKVPVIAIDTLIVPVREAVAVGGTVKVPLVVVKMSYRREVVVASAI